MVDEKIRYYSAKMAKAVERSQGKLFVASHKLQAAGFLLQRQGEENEGVTELYGLGFILEELGEELFEMWRTLDTANFTRQ